MEREKRRRQGLETLAEIRKLRDQIYARTGEQPDSIPFIRFLRSNLRAHVRLLRRVL